jgi:hypothetical protein
MPFCAVHVRHRIPHFIVRLYLLTVCLLSSCLAQTGQPIGEQCGQYPKLTARARQSLAIFAASGAKSIKVDILASRGCVSLIDDVASRSGNVLFADRRVGYARLLVDRTQLEMLIRTKGLEYLSFPVTVPDRAALSAEETHFTNPSSITIPIPHVSTAALASDGPFFATEEAGLAALWHRYPTGDGRGTTVAFIDAGIDLFHPALRAALTADGRVIPKVHDLLAVSQPGEDSAWAQCVDEVTSTGRRIKWRGHEWITPYDGVFAIGVLARKLITVQGYFPKSDSFPIVVGVLWDRNRDKVFVDTNGNYDFSDEMELADYAVRQDVAFFGGKTGDEDNRVPFGIKLDTMKSAVRIFWGGPHGAMAGPLAMNMLTGGLVNGAAPGAQVIDVYDVGEAIPAFVSAASRPDVDVINRSGNIGPASDPEFNEMVAERTLSVYDKAMACYCSVSGAIDVRDWQNSAMLRYNRRIAAPWLPAVNGGTTFRPDGLVNTVLAPSTSLIPRSRYAVYDEDLPSRASVAGPAGYEIGANPSPTVPVVAGILADLVGLARQYKIPYDAERLLDAIFTSAQLLPGFPTAQQGHGRVNAFGAWQQLQAMWHVEDIEAHELTKFRVARMRNGILKPVYGFAASFSPGADRRETIWVKRIGGPTGARPYTLLLKGDPAYRLIDLSVKLAPFQPAPVRFTVERTPGGHLAFIQFIDKRSGVVFHEIPLQTRINEAPERVAAGTDQYTFTVQPRHCDDRFINIRSAYDASLLTISGPYVGRTSFSETFVQDGRRRLLLDNVPVSVDAIDPIHHVGPRQQSELLGVNENVDASMRLHITNRSLPEYETAHSEPAPDVPISVTLTAALYRMAIRRSRETLDLHNRLAKVVGSLVYLRADEDHIELRKLETPLASGSEITIPSGISAWRLLFKGASRTAGTLFAIHCDVTDQCEAMANSEIRDGKAVVTIQASEPGKWTVVFLDRTGHQNPPQSGVTSALLREAKSIAPEEYASGSSRSYAIPRKFLNRRTWVAFRIARPGNITKAELINLSPIVRIQSNP